MDKKPHNKGWTNGNEAHTSKDENKFGLSRRERYLLARDERLDDEETNN